MTPPVPRAAPAGETGEEPEEEPADELMEEPAQEVVEEAAEEPVVTEEYPEIQAPPAGPVRPAGRDPGRA